MGDGRSSPTFIVRIPKAFVGEQPSAEAGRRNKENKNEDKFTKSKRAEALNQKRPPGHGQIQ